MIDMIVRAKNGAIVYDIGGFQIPDHFVRIPVSAGLVIAVKAGDLEEGSAVEQPPAPKAERRRARAPDS
jgi:hypothetical protein